MNKRPTNLNLQSSLTSAMGAFLAHHRALGKRIDSEESALRLLDNYLVEQGVDSLEAIRPAVLEAFLQSRPRPHPRSYNHLLGVLQRLFRWLETQDILTPSPLQARSRRCTSARAPFLFDSTQVEQLLELAARLPDRPHAHLRGSTYRMIFSLMYG